MGIDKPMMVERVIEYCARNRAIVVIGVAFLVALALYLMRRVPLDAIPDLSDTQVIVFTEWMGRSPDLVEDQVTYPIVSTLSAAPRVQSVRGYSMFGMSFIYAIFEEGTDIYWARSRVLEYLQGIRSQLPSDANPVLGPDATSVGWVFQYALVDRSGRHDLAEMRALHDFNIRYALQSLPGVAEVASVGGYERQYQVMADPDRLAGYGVTLSELAGAIRASNRDVGGRVIEQAGREYFVRGRGYIESLEDIRDIVIKVGPTGVPVLVRDVADVQFGGDIRRGVAELDGEGEAVGGIVVMRFGENALDVIERVKEKMDEIRPGLPEGVEFKIVYDRSDLIKRAVGTLTQALFEEGLVVAIVIIVFLLHVRSALVPILALPVAVILAFIPIFLTGMTNNIMSLGGIAIAIGAMVDSSIVLVENAHKRLEGLRPGVPASERTRVIVDAAREVGPSIFFALLIITVSFLPIFGLTGQSGRLFRPLAYTKTFTMALAAVVSITLVPAILVTFLRGRIRPEREHPVSRALIRVYMPFAWVALRRPITTVLIGVFMVVATIPILSRLGSEFMPPLNEGDMLYMPTTFPNLSVEEARRVLAIQDRLIREFPEVEVVFGKAGKSTSPTDPAPLSMVETTIKLRPVSEWRKVPIDRWYSGWAPDWLASVLRPVWPDERPISWDELAEQLDRVVRIPGWTNAWTMPIKTRMDMLTTGIRTPIGLKVFGPDLDTIEKVSLELEGVLSGLPNTRSVFADRNLGGAYVDIVPRPDAIARLGLRVDDVQDLIETAIGGMVVTRTVEGRNRFTVNVRYARAFREDLDSIARVQVPIRLATPGSGMPATPMGSGGGMPATPGMTGGARPMLASAAMPRAEVLGASPYGVATGAGAGPSSGLDRSGRAATVPLGEIADIRAVTGPPMIKDENGMLVGYVFVDLDTARTSIGDYVNAAKAAVAKQVKLPPGVHLKWTGQYELLEEMAARMRLLVPLALALIVLLLYLEYRNLTQILIILATIPFSLVGSFWLLYLLGYHLSTAVWVGIIALAGLAAETGIVMVVYLDSEYNRRKAEGRIRTLEDIVDAHLEGAVGRVRPKMMTVMTTMIGLVPLLWATGTGGDVMKRIAAPMVGGLVTSTFLTLEILPVLVTYWRYWQLKRERAATPEAGGGGPVGYPHEVAS